MWAVLDHQRDVEGILPVVAAAVVPEIELVKVIRSAESAVESVNDWKPMA